MEIFNRELMRVISLKFVDFDLYMYIDLNAYKY